MGRCLSPPSVQMPPPPRALDVLAAAINRARFPRQESNLPLPIKSRRLNHSATGDRDCAHLAGVEPAAAGLEPAALTMSSGARPPSAVAPAWGRGRGRLGGDWSVRSASWATLYSPRGGALRGGRGEPRLVGTSARAGGGLELEPPRLLRPTSAGGATSRGPGGSASSGHRRGGCGRPRSRAQGTARRRVRQPCNGGRLGSGLGAASAPNREAGAGAGHYRPSLASSAGWAQGATAGPW